VRTDRPRPSEFVLLVEFASWPVTCE